jgi:hypothetical protein
VKPRGREVAFRAGFSPEAADEIKKRDFKPANFPENHPKSVHRYEKFN